MKRGSDRSDVRVLVDTQSLSYLRVLYGVQIFSRQQQSFQCDGMSSGMSSFRSLREGRHVFYSTFAEGRSFEGCKRVFSEP